MQTVDELGDEITTLSAHIEAATCRWLRLIAEFDEREGWAAWGCKSCAHWIAWRCSIAPGAAREHVRVARRLRSLPLICEAFAGGALSYSKVRALTRIEDVEDEAALLALARSSTAAQLETIVRAYRGVTTAEALQAHEERHLSFEHDDHGSVLIRGRLPRDEAAVIMAALEAFCAGPAPEATDEADATRATGDEPAPTLAERRADALVDLADAALAAKETATRTGGERFQVVVHVDTDMLARDEKGHARVAGEPLAAETARRLCCDAGIVAMVERDGKPLSVGRKTRSIPPALRRALQHRDRGCRFPGCTSHRWVDAHHIEHWAHGGATALDNLVQLCRHHHRLVHEGGFTLQRRGDAVIFRRPDGRRVRPVPAPARRGDAGCVTDENARRGHAITPTTCVPEWWGDRLHLGDAVDAVLAATARNEDVPAGTSHGHD